MTIEEFYNEAMKNESLMREIDKARVENRLAQLLQERQVDGTEQQFVDFVREKKRESRELTDDELENATGGKTWGTKGRTQDTTVGYEFEIGERVIVDGFLCFNYEGKITWRRYEQEMTYKQTLTSTTGHSTGYYYPVYDVELDDGKTEVHKQDELAHIDDKK